jgi:hypothetical protein
VYFGYYGIIICVAGSLEQKGVRLYGKSNYYLISPKKLARSCGSGTKILFEKSQEDRL